jgi:hypothetical protein
MQLPSRLLGPIRGRTQRPHLLRALLQAAVPMLAIDDFSFVSLHPPLRGAPYGACGTLNNQV